MMSEWVKNVGDVLVWVAGVGVALGAIWGWIAKPIKNMSSKLDGVQGATDMLMGDRLAQAHSYWMHKGYIPEADCDRLVDMHQVYHKRGLNHLVDSYETDLLKLPRSPAQKT